MIFLKQSVYSSSKISFQRKLNYYEIKEIGFQVVQFKKY